MINPVKLHGPWTEGYALDEYITSSKYIGEDVFGHSQFCNTYTDIGELLHALKYNGHTDTSQSIASEAYPFLREWIAAKSIDIVLPVPPTTKRDVQPLFLITQAIAESLSLFYALDVLENTSTRPAKNMSREEKSLKGAIFKRKPAKRTCNILLLDDLFSTGAPSDGMR